MQYSISDVLGDEGRKALDACVKVKIFGWPENIAKYHWDKAWKRIEECYEGYLSLNYGGYGFLQRLILPTETSDRGGPSEEKICDIIDIHNGLEILDEMLYVEKYPKPGPGSEERRKSIDVERADVEREFEEARPGLSHSAAFVIVLLVALQGISHFLTMNLRTQINFMTLLTFMMQ